MSRSELWRALRGRLGLSVSTLGMALWLAVLLPTGVEIRELIAFVPPAAALAVFLRWLSFAFAPSRWTWATGLRAALTGGALLPPILAAWVSLAGSQRSSQLLVLFVLGGWVALGVGLLAGALIYRKPTPSTQPTPAERR